MSAVKEKPREPKLPVGLEDSAHPTRFIGSSETNLQHLVAHLAARDLNFRNVIQCFAEKPLADGTRRKNLVLLVVFLARTDEDVGFFFVGVQVLDADSG